MAPRKDGKPPSRDARSGQYAYDGLDRVFHEKARLSIMTSLLTRPTELSFSDLKLLCALSDGNLSRHLAVLQEAGFVALEREGRGRTACTRYRVSRTGRAAFMAYLAELERVLADAAAARQSTSPAARQLRPGLTAT